MMHFWLAAALLAASASPQSATDQARPVFRSGLDLVRVDVRVTDNEGRPITDLRQDEIRVEEEGTPRPVLLFQHIEAPRGSYVEAAQRTVAAQVSTNQGAPHGHVYVLVFDEAHIVSGHEQRARQAAERFLRAHVKPGDRVALYALPGPGPQIPFTSDVHLVTAQLSAVRGSAQTTGSGTLTPLAPMRTFEAYEIVRGNQGVLDRLTNEASQNLLSTDTRAGQRRSTAAAGSNDPAENRRVLIEDARSIVAHADGDGRRFLMGLADLIRTLRSIDGRKAVILFSEGFPIDNLTHELEDVAAAAAESYSVIYAMDLNTRLVEATEQSPRGGEQSTETLDRLQSLGTLTAATAGTLVPDASSQIDRALARLIDTTEDYYLVGFTPGRTDDRDRYKAIRVTVTRRGAHVSARTGYAVAAKSASTDRRHAIDAALQAPFAQSGLKIEYTTYVLRGSSPNTQRVMLSLVSDLPFASANEKFADVVYVVRDVATGKVAASGTDQITLPDTQQTAAATTGKGVYRVQFELPTGTYLMRAVVREPGGLIGSADRRFQVRALNGPDITASDLVLDSADVKGLAVRATAYESDLLTGVFELYGRTAEQLQAITVMTDLVPVDGSTAAVSAPGTLQSVRSQETGFSRGARVELLLSGVAPGQYLARATIRAGGETITELLRDVTVRPGTRPMATVNAESASGVDPREVLRGEVTRKLIEAIHGRATSPDMESAAVAATSGNWTSTDAALSRVRVHSADASILRGIAAFARGDYASAVALFRAAQDPGTNDSALTFMLGWAYAASGDDRGAITAWRSAVVSDNALVPAYLALVDAYVRLHEPALARQVVVSGLRVLPNSPELQDRLARLGER